MSYSLSPLLKPRFFVNSTNAPLVGGKLFTYLSGTTTPAVSYSDGDGTENTNPIILDVNGECDLYLDDDIGYRLILKDANDVVYFDRDDVYSIGNSAGDAAASAALASTYKDLAQGYALSAETSATSANTYKNQAQDAQAAAEESRINAATSETNAEASAAAALSSETLANGYKNEALAAELAAETARDAAYVNANVYANTTAGLAATTDGQQFSVVQSGELIRYTRISAGVASETGSRITMSTVTNELISDNINVVLKNVNNFTVESSTFGKASTPVTGTGLGNSVFIVGTPMSENSFIRRFNLFTLLAGTVYLQRWARYDTDKFAKISELAVTVNLGSNSIDLVAAGSSLFELKEGEYLGLYGHNGTNPIMVSNTATAADGGYFGSGTGNVSTVTDNTANTTFQIEYNVEIVKMTDLNEALGLCNATGLVSYYDSQDIDKITSVGGDVVEWLNQNSTNALEAYSTVKTPKINKTKNLSFVNANQCLQFANSDYDWTFNSMKVLPVPSVVDPSNQGWPCTGLSRFTDGRWCVGHDGRINEADPTYESRLVIYNPDFSIKLAEIDLIALFSGAGITWQSCQGIWIDASNNIWLADVNNQAIRKINSTGSSILGSITNLGYTPNGIAVDVASNEIFVGRNISSGVISVYDLSFSASPTLKRSFNFGDTPDHLFFDQDRRILFSSHGTNGSNGSVLVWCPDTGRYHGRYYQLKNWQAAEGLYIDESRLYVISDGGFHTNATPPYSMVLTYDLPFIPSQVKSSKLLITGVISRPTLQSGSSATVICASGDPITGTDTGGWALLYLPTANTLRLFAKKAGVTTASAYSIEFALGNTMIGETFAFDLMIDVATGVNLYINGTLTASSTSSGSISALESSVYASQLIVGAFKPYNSGTLTRYSNFIISGLGLFTSDTDRTKIQGWQAWRYGLVSKLPLGHTYKTTPPVF